jgi:hypothetical protein
VPAEFFERLWAQPEKRGLAARGAVVDLAGTACAAGATAKLPAHFDLESSPAAGGFTLELWFKLADLGAGQTLVDSRDPSGTGFALVTTDHRTVQLSMRGAFGGPGRENAVLAETSWDCDPGLLRAEAWHHVVAIVDGAAKIVCFVVDGQLCDGGKSRAYGWARFSRDLRMIPTTKTLRFAPSMRGELDGVRIYNRRLLVSEAVGNWHVGRGATAKTIPR